MTTRVATPFTGRHMLAIMVAFFGVVIAVNVTMARLADSTFGGTVVDNSYVASQDFNRWLADARAESRLGWTATVRLDDDRRLRLSGPVTAATAVARHPLGRAPERTLTFVPAPGGMIATTPLPAGRWIVRLTVHNGTEVRHFESDLS